MIRAKKHFGQHFLHDQGIIDRIVNSIAPRSGQSIVEIGPGLGAITFPLLRCCGQLQAIEIDRDVIDRLRQYHAEGLIIHEISALDFQLPQADDGTLWRVVGNLPYNLSTPLLFHWLDQARYIADLHFLLQKEVVERMAASPGSKQYGRLSVTTQYRCRVEPLFSVSADAFRPPPKVESAFVRLEPYRKPPVILKDQETFHGLLRQVFGQRRKTLRNVLKAQLTAEDLLAAGIDGGNRPEQLTLDQFAGLSNLIYEKNNER